MPLFIAGCERVGPEQNYESYKKNYHEAFSTCIYQALTKDYNELFFYDVAISLCDEYANKIAAIRNYETYLTAPDQK